MNIAVIGAGNVGGTLGRRWADLGHQVRFGLRDPGSGAAAVRGGSPGAPLPRGATVTSIAEAAGSAEVVLLATPWQAVPTAIAAVGSLDGKVLLDATNPLGAGFALMHGPLGESGGEQVQALAPKARVVKIFNTTGFDNMQDPRYDGQPTAMFLAGDDSAAKAIASELARQLGFDPIDAGPLVRSRQLEHLAVLWISLAFGGLGRNIAFRLHRR